MKAEIDKKTGHNLGEEFDAIKKELADIHAAAHRDTDARGKKLADLHSDIENVHKSAAGGDISGHLDSLSRSNEKMLDQLASQHKRMFGVSIFAIAFIIVAGLSLYNKPLVEIFSSKCFAYTCQPRSARAFKVPMLGKETCSLRLVAGA